MSKSAEFYHPSFDLDRAPKDSRQPTWLDRFFSPGDISRIVFETPLEKEDGMKIRQRRVRDELIKAKEEFKGNNTTTDRERLQETIEVYTLLTEEVEGNETEGILIASKVASVLHEIKTSFGVKLPSYEVFFEEE